MLDSNLWSTGLTSMVVGMGIVFSFLVVLIFAMNIMTKCVEIINKLCPIQEASTKTVKKATADDSAIALAIAIAKFHK